MNEKKDELQFCENYNEEIAIYIGKDGVVLKIRKDDKNIKNEEWLLNNLKGE